MHRILFFNFFFLVFSYPVSVKNIYILRRGYERANSIKYKISVGISFNKVKMKKKIQSSQYLRVKINWIPFDKRSYICIIKWMKGVKN